MPYTPRQPLPTNTLTKPHSIFANLPNDLVMKIIKQADGGRGIHKLKLNTVLEQFMERGDGAVGDYIAACDNRLYEFYFIWYNHGNPNWLGNYEWDPDPNIED